MSMTLRMEQTRERSELGDFKGAKFGLNKQEKCICDLCGKSIGFFEKIFYTVSVGKVFPKHLRYNKEIDKRSKEIKYREKIAHLSCVLSAIDQKNLVKIKAGKNGNR